MIPFLFAFIHFSFLNERSMAVDWCFFEWRGEVSLVQLLCLLCFDNQMHNQFHLQKLLEKRITDRHFDHQIHLLKWSLRKVSWQKQENNQSKRPSPDFHCGSLLPFFFAQLIEQWKKPPGCLGYIGMKYDPVINGDYLKSTIIRIPDP